MSHVFTREMFFVSSFLKTKEMSEFACNEGRKSANGLREKFLVLQRCYDFRKPDMQIFFYSFQANQTSFLV